VGPSETKEIRTMKRLWARKWLVAVGAVVIFLSVGAVAWAATGDDENGWDHALNAASSGLEYAAGLAGAQTASTDGTTVQDRRQARQERREERVERQQALLEHLRDDMSAADQETDDQLMGTIDEQRQALQEARQELAGTLKELRQLVDKYVDAGSGSD
jgi:hypothetical protein